MTFMGNPFEILHTGKVFNYNSLVALLKEVKPTLDLYMDSYAELPFLLK